MRLDVRDSIRDLVRALTSALNKYQQLIVEDSKLDDDLTVIEEECLSDTGSPQSHSSWDAMSNEFNGSTSCSSDEILNPILSEQKSYVKTILSQLQRISLAIRKSGNKHRFEKVDAALDEGKFEEFRKHLTATISMAFEDTKANTLTTVQKMQRASDYNRLTPIQRRMVRANILRRHRIEFVTGSQIKNITPTFTSEPAVTANKLTEFEAIYVDNSLDPSRPAPSITVPSCQTTTSESIPSAPRSSTVTATDVGSKLDIKHILAKRTSSTATKMTRIGSSRKYPNCPNPGSDGAVRCPYCNDILPFEFSKSKHEDSWKAHVTQDIIPYSCIVDGCDTPDEMYATADALLAHTLELHSTLRWACDYCAFSTKEGNDSVDEVQKLFESAEEWQSHISLRHEDNIPINQRGILDKLNNRRVVGPLCCPLCDFNTLSMDTKIDDHILQHLHEFVLRALPDVKEEGMQSQGKMSEVSGLLSHTQLDSANATIAQDYPPVTMQEIEDAIDKTWDFVWAHRPKIRRPLQVEDSAMELWQTKCIRLKEILNAIRFIDQNGIMRGYPSIQDMADEALYDMNSAAVVETGRKPIKQPYVIRDISVPYLPSSFIGHESLLARLDDLLSISHLESKRQPRVALIGPNGSGKTSIARSFVHGFREKYKDCSVFWVDASTEKNIEQSYNNIMRQFGELPEWPFAILNKIRRFVHHLTWTFGGHWLIVLDGLQCQTALYLSLENLLPQGLKGRLLFTALDPTHLALLGPVETIEINLDGHIHADDIITIEAEKQNRNCLRDLRLTDPLDDRRRIEATKEGLLRDSCQWILEDSAFQQWQNDEECRLLWIKGNPGMGKTVLLCDIINELEMQNTNLLSYHFCRFTDPRWNNPRAVLRSLIYLIVIQQPSLIYHVRKKYDTEGKACFDGPHAWDTLSDIFDAIVRDPYLKSTILVIDALDECLTGLSDLIDLIVQLFTSTRVKWIVSSHHEYLATVGQKVTLSLDQNARYMSATFRPYIEQKVEDLALRNNYNQETRNAILQSLLSHSNDTFIWAALVFQELESVPSWRAIATLECLTSGTNAFYEQMIKRIFDSAEADLGLHILNLLTIVYRNITLHELASLVDLLGKCSDEGEFLVETIRKCGPILDLRENTIVFVHQSAKEFLLDRAPSGILTSKADHYTIFSRSLQAMFKMLRRDMYDLCHPGTSIDDIHHPEPDPLASIRYSCIYWVDHLSDAISNGNPMAIDDVRDNGRVFQFLSKKFTYWLEALSLLQNMAEGVAAMTKLETLLKEFARSSLLALVQDARQFILSFGWIIEKAPLQVYTSALVFSPTQSMTRKLFKLDRPCWITAKSAAPEEWDACIATLEGHGAAVSSVDFSPDGQHLASASSDGTIKVWNALTGYYLITLDGHIDSVSSVAFSPCSNQLASASYDMTIKIWDIITGQCLLTFDGHSEMVSSVAFSPTGQHLASASHDETVKIWDSATGKCLSEYKAHSDTVCSVDFSFDGRYLASASSDQRVMVWDTMRDHIIMTIEGNSNPVCSVSFSPCDHRLAIASFDEGIKIWDVVTGQCLATFDGHRDVVCSVAFSPDVLHLASASRDRTVKIWDLTTGHCTTTLEGHGSGVLSVAFSPDGQHLASASDDRTAKIWDLTRNSQAISRGHSDKVYLIVLSHNGQYLASVSCDKTVKIWDTTTGLCQETFDIDQRLATISFDESGKKLHSDAGTFDLNVSSPSSSSTHHQDQDQDQEYNVSDDGACITHQGRNLLWLPSEYRAAKSAIAPSTVALGCVSGRVSIFRFMDHNLV